VGSTEHFRNIERHDVAVQEGVLALRIDESLYFANARSLEARLLGAISADRSIRHVLLICSGINFIDATGLESLESCHSRLEDAGVTFNLAEVKGPVTDRLSRVEFLKRLGEERLFLSTHDAMARLGKARPLGDVPSDAGRR
jgi:SulP family sulfate permease